MRMTDADGEKIFEKEIAEFKTTKDDRIPRKHVYDEKYGQVKIIGDFYITLRKNIFKPLHSISKNYHKIILSDTSSFDVKSLKAYFDEFKIQIVDKENNENLKLLQVTALYNYTTDHYEVINNSLLKDDPDLLTKHAPYIKLLRSAIIESYQELPDIVYRKIHLEKEELESYKVDETIYIQSFVSTTKNKEIMNKWKGNVCIQIYLTRKSRISVCDITNYSAYPKEEEVLILPYTKFKIMDRDDKTIYLQCIDHSYTDKDIQRSCSLM